DRAPDAPGPRTRPVGLPRRQTRLPRRPHALRRCFWYGQDLLGRGDGRRPRSRPPPGRHLPGRLQVDRRNGEEPRGGLRRCGACPGRPPLRRGGRAVRQADRGVRRTRQVREPRDRLPPQPAGAFRGAGDPRDEPAAEHRSCLHAAAGVRARLRRAGAGGAARALASTPAGRGSPRRRRRPPGDRLAVRRRRRLRPQRRRFRRLLCGGRGVPDHAHPSRPGDPAGIREVRSCLPRLSGRDGRTLERTPMATPTTVLEYAENTLLATTNARAAAQAESTAAQEAIAQARTDLEDATAALKETELDLAGKRAELAQADTPAEAATLAAELAELVALQRERQAELLTAREALADALSSSQRVAATLTRLRSRLARAEADLAAATRYADTRTAIKDAASAPPLDTIAADADAVLSGDEFSEAETLITDALPERLLAAARRGYEFQLAR